MMIYVFFLVQRDKIDYTLYSFLFSTIYTSFFMDKNDFYV